MKHFDVIIVGGGATGAAALYQLAQRGITNTLLIEKKGGYGQGATGSWGSLVRILHANLHITQSAAKCVPFYLDFDKTVGYASQFNPQGSLYFLKQSHIPAFREHFAAMDSSELPYEVLEPLEGKKRFPEFLWYEDDVAIFESYAGVACPWAVTHGLVNHAVARGATALLNTKVIEIENDGARVLGVKTLDGERFGCDQLVLSTGIWTPNLIEKIGSRTDVYPEVIQLNRFCSRHEVRKHPLFIDLSNRIYGHSSFNGSFVGGYLDPEPKTPNHRKAIQHVNLREANLSKQKLSMRLAWIRNSTIEGGLRAIDSYTPSKRGTVAFDPKFSNLLVSAGWSCGGFTTAPFNGEMIADRLIEIPGFAPLG